MNDTKFNATVANLTAPLNAEGNCNSGGESGPVLKYIRTIRRLILRGRPYCWMRIIYYVFYSTTHLFTKPKVVSSIVEVLVFDMIDFYLRHHAIILLCNIVSYDCQGALSFSQALTKECFLSIVKLIAN